MKVERAVNREDGVFSKPREASIIAHARLCL